MNTINSDRALNFNAISDLFKRLSKHKAVIIEPLIVNFGIFTIGLVTVSMANESIGIPVGLREVVILNFYYLMPRFLWVLLVRIYFYTSERQAANGRANNLQRRGAGNFKSHKHSNHSIGHRIGVCKRCRDVYDPTTVTAGNGGMRH